MTATPLLRIEREKGIPRIPFSRSVRIDALSMANTEKFAGRPQILREDIDENFALPDARRLVSRLQNRWNRQQTRIYRVDS